MKRILALTCWLLSGCDVYSPALDYRATQAPPYNESELLPGGETSVSIKPFASLEKPAANMTSELKPNFHAGKALANQPWIKAPTTTTARDGLGPVYNARTCLACHIKGGKGTIPDNSETPLSTTLVRVGKSHNDPSATAQLLQQQGLVPHPVYGDQIQHQSTSLSHQLRHIESAKNIPHDVAPEAYMHVQWQESKFVFPDGREVMLRKPTIDFRYLGYGPLGDDTLLSIRVAPSIHGMGLLELIEQQDINALADEADKNQDGISGRVNQVWDVKSQTVKPGRFGLKSNKPTLEMIVAAAFTNDIGITNYLFPNQPCTAKQENCVRQITGNDDEGVELPKHLLELVVDFNRNLAPLKRQNPQTKAVLKGRELFYQSGCNQCHQPRFVTGKSERFTHLSKQEIWPYTDLLLHDMGPELADNRPEFLASGQEWRTAPLWNLGDQPGVSGSHVLLHDGRARNVEEAILWHGGEAENAKDKFIHLPVLQREALMEFVYSL
ncbi:di-heme oxidoreductase family protein [Pseudomonas sp. HK3]